MPPLVRGMFKIFERLQGRKISLPIVAEYFGYLLRIKWYQLRSRLRLGQGQSRQLFCDKPFTWFETKADGNVFLCCSGWLPMPVGNLGTMSPDQIWNSRKAQDVRRSILDGSFAYCRENRCPALKDQRLPQRQAVSDPVLREVIDRGLTRMSRPPSTVNAGYDRTCNLSCPSCRTETIQFNDTQRAVARSYQDKIVDWLPSGIQEIYVTGSGDAFASQVYRDLYRDFDDTKTPDLKFRIHTNGLLLTSNLWNSIPKIHKRISEMEVSIDAASAGTYTRLRRNGHFEVLLKRLEFIRSLKDGGYIPNLIFSFVVQKDNFREMPDFVALAEKYRADIVNFSALFDWGTYSASDLSALQVHLPGHPEHREFLATLRHAKMSSPIVRLGNLSGLVDSPERMQDRLVPVPI